MLLTLCRQYQNLAERVSFSETIKIILFFFEILFSKLFNKAAGSLNALQTIFISFICLISSTLAFFIETEFSPSSFFICIKKEVFFLFESTKVISLLGSIIPRQIPGKPDPVPRVNYRSRHKMFLQNSTVQKCSAKSFFLKFLDTKFRVLFHFKIWFKYLSA